VNDESIIGDVQPRARAGGEFGANGEWYKGGAFIATSERTRKGRMRHEPTVEELQRIAAERAEHEARVARHKAWIAARIERFTNLLNELEDDGVDQWGNRRPQAFRRSLAQQLRESGSLSLRQAECAVRIMFGRETKRNSNEYCEMRGALCERYEDQGGAA